MMNFTSFLKMACTAGLMAFPLCSFGTLIRSFKFAPEFVRELELENIEDGDLKIRMCFFNNEEDAVFPENITSLPSINYSNGKGMFSGKKPDVQIADADSMDLYYYMFSKHIMIEKGHVRVSTKNQLRDIVINPLTQCKKMVLKSSIGTDGIAVPTNILLLNDYKRKKGHWNLRSNWFEDGNQVLEDETFFLKPVQRYDDETDEPLPLEASTTAFWAKRGSEIPYMVYSLGQYMMKDGILKLDDTTATDSIALDYRKAKKVHFGVKDVRGEQMDLRTLFNGSHDVSDNSSLTFQSKYSTNNCLQLPEPENYIYHLPLTELQFDKPILSFDFYAFPGEYIFSFWAMNGFEDQENGLCPKGLEGRLVVGDESEQFLNFDFSRYITLNVKSDMEPVFNGTQYTARNSKKSESGNALLDRFEFTFKDNWQMTKDYTVIEPQNPGEYKVKIWPAVGYETVDIKGTINDYEVVVDNIDFNKQREFNIEVPSTGIEEMTEEEIPVAYYDLSGRRLSESSKGINLIRMQNGKVKKVMIK